LNVGLVVYDVVVGGLGDSMKAVFSPSLGKMYGEERKGKREETERGVTWLCACLPGRGVRGGSLGGKQPMATRHMAK